VFKKSLKQKKLCVLCAYVLKKNRVKTKNSMIKHLRKSPLKTIIKTRKGETKLGERIATNWQEPSVKFVLLGIEEDIGVRVNGGVGGTATAWQAFLNAFVNIQSTDALNGSEIGIYGHFNFDELKDSINSETINLIDKEVCETINSIAKLNKIPIVIGGGHNNAYPIIKGISMAKNEAINTINLDAHSDFRAMEGRHSGNGFRYAYTEGFLKKYVIIGLHENYNNQLIINELKYNEDIWFCFWEDIFLREKLTFKEAIYAALDFAKHGLTGIELDLDSLENTLSSAMTPCGFSATQARQYIHHLAQNRTPAYLHICEGASQLVTGQQSPLIGKLISYLVSDFMKVARL
jgi:formiminoglutamase